MFNKFGKTYGYEVSIPTHIRIKFKMDRCENTTRLELVYLNKLLVSWFDVKLVL